MLLPRIIPCLLVRKGGLVKTVNFQNAKYVGDPINAVKIFNEKEVDELIVLDIDASIHSKEPDYNLITKLAVECRMPLCYGGGVRTIEQVERIIGLGVEKVALSSAACCNPNVISSASELVGAQSIVVVMDLKKDWSDNKYSLWTHNGRNPTKLSAIEFAKQVEGLGAGEIVINSIDRDGTMKGYDFNLVKAIRQVVSLPVTVIGGAGSLNDIAKLIQMFGTIGAAAGSLFVFKGKYRAVLINYPNREEKNSLILQVQGQ